MRGAVIDEVEDDDEEEEEVGEEVEEEEEELDERGEEGRGGWGPNDPSLSSLLSSITSFLASLALVVKGVVIFDEEVVDEQAVEEDDDDVVETFAAGRGAGWGPKSDASLSSASLSEPYEPSKEVRASPVALDEPVDATFAFKFESAFNKGSIGCKVVVEDAVATSRG